MKKLFFLVASFYFLSALFAFGDEVIIFGNNYKIPKIYNEENVPKGVLVDILKYIDSQLDYNNFHIKLYPWKRAYTYAAEGEGGIIGLSKTEERLKIFDYSDVVFYDDVIIVVLKGNEFPFETIEDLQGKRIGIGRGGSFGDEFEVGKKSIFKIIEDDGPVMRLRMLLVKNIDCAFFSPGKASFLQSINKNEKLLKHADKFAILPKPFKSDPNYLGFSKKMNMKDFLTRFNMVLNQGYTTGAIQEIINKYKN